MPLQAPRVLNQTWTYDNFNSGTGYNKNNPYELAFDVGGSAWGGINKSQLGCGIQGYGRPINPDFSRGCFEPLISPTIPQCQMSYGRIMDTPVPVYKKRFRIPMASSIAGIHIPPDQFRLFPV